MHYAIHINTKVTTFDLINKVFLYLVNILNQQNTSGTVIGQEILHTMHH